MIIFIKWAINKRKLDLLIEFSIYLCSVFPLEMKRKRKLHFNKIEKRMMAEHGKDASQRVELRERIITAATEAFTSKGIKSITMDDIAAALGISKRTLYEVFSDKESLLKECILKAQADRDIAIAQAEADKAANEARVLSDTQIAQKNNELEIRRAELKIISDNKKAEACLLYTSPSPRDCS